MVNIGFINVSISCGGWIINLLILTPIFAPSTGGASTYYSLLSSMLLKSNVVKRIVIVTEKVPGKPSKEILKDGSLIVLRIFPFRAGSKRGVFSQYVKYAIQNVQYFKLLGFIKKYSIHTLLIHSSFHNFLNLMSCCILEIRKRTNCTLVADVRDWQMPVKHLKQLEYYDRVITCSGNTFSHVVQLSALKKKTQLIPVIQDKINRPTQKDISKLLQKFDIAPCRYISYNGLIKTQKGIELLIAAYMLLAANYKDLHLILAGAIKDHNLLKEVDQHNRIHFIGSISRQEVIVLTAGSQLSVNLSVSEGMPRSSLEALALGVQVALPPNIPEFIQYCPSHVVDSREAKVVAKKLGDLLHSADKPVYPINKHNLNNICQKYNTLFESIS